MPAAPSDGFQGAVSLRPLQTQDLDEAAATLSHAFFEDPFLIWALGDPEVDAEHLVPLMRRSLAGHMRHGSVTVADRTREIVGVAVWAPSRHSRLSPGRRLGLYLAAAGTFGFGAARRLSDRPLARRRPSRPHSHLVALGVKPVDRRRGIASRLMDGGLVHCDAAGVPAYAEICDPRASAFLERFGFLTYDTEPIPGGPVVWRMWRHPA